jgi:starvation-inducible DNA-binding protein
MNQELQKIAQIAFASEFSFYLTAANFHWNVTGPNFEQYHSLFERIYTEVYGSIDDFAENIRKLGAPTPASLNSLSQLSKISGCDEMLDAQEMLAALLMNNEKMIALLKFTFQASEAAFEPGFSDFIAGRIDAHRKHGWMLGASLEQPQTTVAISL